MPDPIGKILQLVEDLEGSDANEAETRFKIIDQVVFDILGWTRDDIAVEHRAEEDGDVQITDYMFATAATLFVIEAKRIGSRGPLEVDSRRLPLTATNLTGEFGKAVRQARDFCRIKNVPFAIVTNGSYWFAFPAIRTDGVPFGKSSGVLFNSIASTLNFNLDEFKNLLHRDAVLDGSLRKNLLGTIENQAESRRLNLFVERSTPKLDRSNIFDLVKDQFYIALNSDIGNAQPALLKEGYVSTPSRIRFDARIKMHVSRRKSVAPKRPLRAMRDADRRSFEVLIENAADNVRPTAMLVLGAVGSGKTTFLDYTRHVALAEHFESRPDQPYAQWFQLDFRDFSEKQNARAFTFQKLFAEVQRDEFLSDYDRCIKHAYAEEIESLKRGPLSLFSDNEDEIKKGVAGYLSDQYRNVEIYTETILKYASQNASIFLVVDNIDQIESLSVQEQIFSEAMAIAHSCGLNLIISMRDSTYVKNRTSPTFDAFDFDPIQIEPPAIESVLSKRFNIAAILASGKSGEFTAENGSRFIVEDLKRIVDLLRYSVLGTEIGRQIGILSGGDVRLAIRMTREFLQFGYSATERAYKIYERTGKYRLPPHEAMRAIILGNQPVYKEEFSVLGNIFDAKLGRTELQMSRMFVLNALVGLATNSQFQSISATEIASNAGQVGIGETAVLKVLRDLSEFRFIQTISHTEASLTASYIPTQLGGHIIRIFMSDFTYCENVMMDTFISDDEDWKYLREHSEKILSSRFNILLRLRLRKERATRFFEHMSGLYKAFHEEARKRSLSSEWCVDPFDEARKKLQENLQNATRSAERNYGPKQ